MFVKNRPVLFISSVYPFLLSLNINDIVANHQSKLTFYDKQQIHIVCEVYSYPRAVLQLSLNQQIINTNETIDCLNDDFSTVLLSNSLCLSQTNWRIRLRINTTLDLSSEHHEQILTCSVIDFPFGNTWRHSTYIQFIETKGKS